MSSSLHWRPARKPQPDPSLPSAVKYPVARRFFDHDGSLGNPRDTHLLTLSDLSYFEGLADANVEGAKEIIGLLAKYGEIEVWIS